MIIYLDIVFFENMCMNYIILLTTNLINKIKLTKIRNIRIIIASMLGSIYAIVVYLNILNIYNTLSFKILVSIVMIYIVFKPNKLKLLLKELTIFYIISFVFGGCAFFLLYYIKPDNVYMKNGVYIGTYPIKIAILGGILSFFIIYIWVKISKNEQIKNNICSIEILFNNNRCELKALVDTGNFLKEPITGKSVIIVEKSKLKNVISDNILENLNKILNGYDINISNEYLSKLKILPFKSLGKENGILLGIQVNKIIVSLNENQYEKVNAIIGIYDGLLSKNQTYSALVSQDMLEGVKDECY